MTRFEIQSDIPIIVLNFITLISCMSHMVYAFVTNWLIVFQTIVLVFWLFRYKKVTTRYFVLLCLVSAFSCIAIFANGGGYGSILVIINVTLMLYISTIASFSKSTRMAMFAGYTLLGIFWLLRSNIGLYNPNTIGLIALFCLVFFDQGLCDIKLPPLMRALLSLLFTLLIFVMLIEKSRSRASIAAIVFYLLATNFVPIKWLTNRYIYNTVFLLLTVGSLIWTQVLVYFYQNDISVSLFFSTKNFYTGRERIWSEVWPALKNSWLFGIGTKYTLTSFPTFNLHNSMLNLLAAYGVLTAVPFVFFLYAIYKNLINRLADHNDRLAKISIIAFATLLIHGFNELTLFSTMFLAPMVALLSRIEKHSALS